MYVKLIIRNAKRSAKEYLIYIVTLTICVSMFYSFLSITSSHYNPDIGSQFDVNMLNDGMKLAICCITFILIFLIKYVNNYMIIRKQKDFGIQTLLGMEQKTVAIMFFFETLIMGVISLLAGILFGMVFSQIISALLLTIYGRPFQIMWMLYPDTVLLTISFFMIGFILIGFMNMIMIHKLKIIDMLTSEKTNEESHTKSKWMIVVTILFITILVWMISSGISIMLNFYDNQMPQTVRFVIWGNIFIPAMTLIIVVFHAIKKQKNFSKLIRILLISALPIIGFTAATLLMKMRYNLALNSGVVNKYLLFVLIGLCYVLCASFYLISEFIVWLKEKHPKIKYKEENLFLFGQLITKLKTTTKTMSLICITMMLSIISFLATPAISGWILGFLDYRAVCDIQVYSAYSHVKNIEDLPVSDYEFIPEYLRKNNLKIAYDCQIELYLTKADDLFKHNKYDYPILAMSLSDYNDLLFMIGNEPILLKSDEYTTQWESTATQDEITAFKDKGGTLSTDAGTLYPTEHNAYFNSLGETIYNNANFIYILPDKICEKLLAVNQNYYIKTDEPIPFKVAEGLEREFKNKFPASENGSRYFIRTKTLQVNSTTASVFIMIISMIYMAVVLLIASFTILALQQLFDASHYKYRYGVLHKMGVDNTTINNLILKQLAIWFGLPVGIAILSSIIFIFCFFSIISVEISAFIGINILLKQVVFIAIVIIVLLFCYFITTWILYKQIVFRGKY